MTREERSAYNKAYKEKHKEQIEKRRKKFYQENRERLVAAQKKYNETHITEIKAYRRKYYRYKSYGIDKISFEQLLHQQNNRCKICEVEFDLEVKWKSPHIDHNHSTGKVRSLLCQKCNLGLGNFRETPDFLVRAIEYLKYQE